MPPEGFEPVIPALDYEATVIGPGVLYYTKTPTCFGT
jgi:hypothetical protein